MAFDNKAFTQWLVDFEKYLIESGLSPNQAMKYRGEYYNNAVAYFAKGTSPGDAAMKELLG